MDKYWIKLLIRDAKSYVPPRKKAVWKNETFWKCVPMITHYCKVYPYHMHIERFWNFIIYCNKNSSSVGYARYPPPCDRLHCRGLWAHHQHDWIEIRRRRSEEGISTSVQYKSTYHNICRFIKVMQGQYLLLANAFSSL